MSNVYVNHISDEGRQMMEKAITQATLIRLNKYALDNKWITEEMYRKMDFSIRVNYDEMAAKLEQA